MPRQSRLDAPRALVDMRGGESNEEPHPGQMQTGEIPGQAYASVPGWDRCCLCIGSFIELFSFMGSDVDCTGARKSQRIPP